MNERQNLFFTIVLIVALMGSIVFFIHKTLANDRYVFVSDEREVISCPFFGELLIIHNVPDRYTDEEKQRLYTSISRWVNALDRQSLTEIELVYVAYVTGLANEVIDSCDYQTN